MRKHRAGFLPSAWRLASIDQREKLSKWKVSRNCVNYLEERRLYHRKDGEIVKLRDDTLSAARYGMMMKRHFKPLEECSPVNPGAPWSAPRKSRDGSEVARNTDFDVFSGEPFGE